MSNFQYCSVEHKGRLCIVTIKRPEVMNALHRPSNLELEQIFNEFESNPDLWVAILTGEGDKAFCAGNDLKFQAQGNDTTHPDTGFAGLTARFGLTKPVIAAVNGLAMGGGFEIALSCDLIIASENAFFALTEPLVGLAATAGGLLRLPRQIPMKQAMGIILTGRRVTAEEAEKLGFVNEVTPVGGALEAAERWAELILQCSPMSIRGSIDLVNRGLDCDNLEEAYRKQKQFPEVKALYESADRIEGPLAFSEKRKPVWQGK